jgi:hypothetical protein
MKVILRESGGYAAPLGGKTCKLDTSTLEAGDVESLQSLIKNSGLLESQQTDWKNPNVRDPTTYVLIIEETAGQSRQFSFDVMSIPERAVPLMEYLLDRCR